MVSPLVDVFISMHRVNHHSLRAAVDGRSAGPLWSNL